MFSYSLVPLRRPELTLFFLWLFYLPFFSYSQTAKIDSSSMATLRINPQDARGADVSQVLDAVEFIPLETTKESLFGSVADLKILKGHYIVFDYDTRSVLIFSDKGKFKGKVDSRMMAEDDKEEKGKNQVYGFQLSTYMGDSVIAIQSPRHLHYFSLRGERIAKVLWKDAQIDRDLPLLGKDVKIRQGFVQRNGKDSTYYHFAIINKKDTIPYFPFDLDRYKTDEFWDGPKFFNYGTPGEIFFSDFHGFDLYKIKPDKLSLAYKIILPLSNSLPKDFTTNPIYVKRRGEFFRNNQKVFFRLGFAYQFGNNLYLQMRCYSPTSELKHSLIYNLQTSEMTSLLDLQPDKLSSFLPVNDAQGYWEFINRGFHLLKDDYLYTSYSSLAMFSFKEQLGERNKDFGPLLNEYFKTQNRKSNPVIVRLKPKKN